MKLDPGSNYRLDGADVSTTDDVTSLVIDHQYGPSGAFYLVCKSVVTSLNAKLQYGENGTDYTDEPDTTAGNDTAIVALTGAGERQINVPNPRGRYSRLLCTTVGAGVAVAFSVVGPLRHKAAE